MVLVSSRELLSQFTLLPSLLRDLRFYPGGAGSEVWNRVYMIAPVKKFGRVGLCTNFIQTNMAVARKEN